MGEKTPVFSSLRLLVFLVNSQYRVRPFISEVYGHCWGLKRQHRAPMNPCFEPSAPRTTPRVVQHGNVKGAKIVDRRPPPIVHHTSGSGSDSGVGDSRDRVA